MLVYIDCQFDENIWHDESSCYNRLWSNVMKYWHQLGEEICKNTLETKKVLFKTKNWTIVFKMMIIWKKIMIIRATKSMLPMFILAENFSNFYLNQFTQGGRWCIVDTNRNARPTDPTLWIARNQDNRKIILREISKRD